MLVFRFMFPVRFPKAPYAKPLSTAAFEPFVLPDLEDEGISDKAIGALAAYGSQEFDFNTSLFSISEYCEEKTGSEYSVDIKDG